MHSLSSGIFTANKIPKILNQAVKVSKLQKDLENSKATNSNANPCASTNPTSDSQASQPKETGDWILEKLDLSGMEEWSTDLQGKAKSLLMSYADIFSKDDMDMGTTHVVKHHIKLSDPVPFKEKYKRIPPHLYDEVREHLKEMLALGAIRKSQSPWSSPIVLVRKKDGKLRFCIDLRKLNQRTVRDNYSLPKIDHMLEQLIGAEWFCTLDLKSGYWQVELTEESKPYTAFTCGPLGFYECEKMPFGASNAPATFQRLMENCLGDLNLSWCVVYLDDIIVYGKSPEELLTRLEGVFSKLRAAGLKLKPSKCDFFRTQITFLGHIVSKQGIATCPDKIQAVKDWPIPKTVNDLRSFLGFVGYYRKFIQGFSQIARPLNSLLEGTINTKRANKKQMIDWGSEQEEAFNTLKEACINAPVLGYPNYEQPFILHTDASTEGLGAVLYQKDDDGKVRVIAYASRSLKKSERNYPAHKLEFLALKWAITEKLREYLLGAPFFEVFTDNNPLTYVLTSAKLDATSQRWVADLASFTFSIVYRSGKQNADADALSRIPWSEAMKEISDSGLDNISKESVFACFQGVHKLPSGYIEIFARSALVTSKPDLEDSESAMTPQNWKDEQKKDPALVELFKLLEKGNPLRYCKKKEILKHLPLVEPFCRHLKQFELRDDIIYRKAFSENQGHKSCLWQIVLPTQLVPTALQGCHDHVGHLGRDRTLSLLRERFYWPTLYRDTVEHLDSCRKCKLRKASVPRAEMCPINVSRPMELVHLDYLCIEPCKGKFENILVVTDHFTRYAQAFATKSQTAQMTAKVLFEKFICHYGFPEKFISDQGRNFESQLIADLCKLAKVKKVRTTPYHPMTNGQCERFNKTLCDMLGTLNQDEKEDWKSHIHTLTHAYNCTKNSSTGYSPFYLVFGRHPRLPVDVEFGLHRMGNDLSFSKSKFIDRLHKRLNRAFDRAKSFSEKESERQKKYFDIKSKDIKLESGDVVLVRRTAWKSRHKIQNRWEDEDYVIIDQPNSDIPVYKVRNLITNQEKTLHRNLLLPMGYSLNPVVEDENDTDEEYVLPLIQLAEGFTGEQSSETVGATKPKTPMKVAFSDQPIIIEESVVDSNANLPSDQLSGNAEPVQKKEESFEPPYDPLHSLQEGDLFTFFESMEEDMGEAVSAGDLTVVSDTTYEASTESQESKDSTKSSIGFVDFLTDQTPSLDPSFTGDPAKEISQESPKSKPEEIYQPRRSQRSTRGAPPQWYGNIITHQSLLKPLLKSKL